MYLIVCSERFRPNRRRNCSTSIEWRVQSATWSARSFYGGALKSPILKPEIPFPTYPKLVTWLDTSRLTAGDPEKKVGTSWASPLECRVVKSQLAQLDFVARSRRKKYEVAVIAGYAAQVRSLEDAIRDYQATWSNLKVRVNTVDAFQGSEADICIYSVVRSNVRGDAGFLSEPPAPQRGAL